MIFSQSYIVKIKVFVSCLVAIHRTTTFAYISTVVIYHRLLSQHGLCFVEAIVTVDLKIGIVYSLRTGSQRGRKKIRRAKRVGVRAHSLLTRPLSALPARHPGLHSAISLGYLIIVTLQ